MKSKVNLIFIVLFAFVSTLTTPANSAESFEYDVIIYGGTSAGVSAAVQVARMGKTVAIIEPGRHLGGMSASGLGATDVGNKFAIGGIALEFYQNIHRHYFGGIDNNPGQYLFEPHVAESIFNEMVKSYEIPVFFGVRLERKQGVSQEKNKIISIKMESGEIFSGKMFIDATYEGDLMAASGVTYRIGRESNDEYGETLNGIQFENAKNHNFNLNIDPYIIPGVPESGLLPNIHGEFPGNPGEGDFRVQAYNFRFCMTNDPENRIDWFEPEDYDPLNYELLLRYFDAGFSQVPLHIRKIYPANKSDTNNNTAFSTDYIGRNYDYPDADYAEREEIFRDHMNYQLGLLWTLYSNPRVPESVRNTIAEWGLAADEFTDDGNLPWQMYIREARRMVSDYVMTEYDCRGERSPADSVGMGSYPMDSHNVQRYVDSNGFARNEGDFYVHIEPYSISYRSIIPSIGECENLIVPICISATHPAFGSIRMEPVFMILGQSAGTSAVIAIDTKTSVQDVYFPAIRYKLTVDSQVLGKSIGHNDLNGWVIDDSSAILEGGWEKSQVVFPYIDDGYIHDNNGQKGCSATFRFKPNRTGKYEIRFIYTPHENRASNVPVEISTGTETHLMFVDERIIPSINRMSISLGEFELKKKEFVSVRVSNEGADGYVVADAVQFLFIG